MSEEKKIIKVKCVNGIDFRTFIDDIIASKDLEKSFEFIASEQPNLLIFGPYGNDLPPKGNYIRVGYFCENITPDMTTCEWAFGVPREEEIQHLNYQRIQWHGLDPKVLLKNIDDNEIDQIFNQKTKFCNFLYSHQVPYREEFFKQLSKYKKVDAPGRSMNNMASIDQLYKGNIWERKRQFLKQYKFTIAFENYVYPGYQTEKLYDAMQCYSIPIYCGDPYINEVFNTNSFINVSDYKKPNNNSLVKFLERNAQLNFRDILPLYHRNPKDRIQRKLKDWGKKLKMFKQFHNSDFSEVIDRIIELDQNPDLYKNMIKESWFNQNQVASITTSKTQWMKILKNL
ncbi:MAG: glycosyltransferase family 10 [Pelobium sp.]